jgi:hypothetical protein
MSCALGRDGSAPDIAASFLKVRLRRDGWGSWARARNRAPPFNSAMQELTGPGGTGALQLIARLAGSARRLDGFAPGFGAAPPDQWPRA